MAYNNRGWTKYLHGDLKGAVSDSNKALGINPNDGDSLGTCGLAKHGLGQDESACTKARIFKTAVNQLNDLSCYWNLVLGRHDQ